MGSSGGGQQTTVTKNEPPAYLQPYYTEVAQEASNLYNQGAPAYFPGSTVAPTSDATMSALQGIRDRAMGPQNLQGAAEGVYQNVLNPAYTDVANDPVLRGAMDAANAATIEQFRDATAPGIASTFNQAGRLSSGAVGGVMGGAQSALGRSLSESNANILYGALRDRQNQQLSTAANAPGLAAAGYAPYQQLAGVGAAEEGIAQNQINADMERYNYEANAPKLALQDYINMLQGTAGGQGVSTSMGPGQSSNGLLNAASAAAGIGSLLSGFAAFSDRRLKTNIRRIGQRPDGLGVYTFGYHWQPDDLMVGVMADEVAKVYPDAVEYGIGGFAKVNYGKLV